MKKYTIIFLVLLVSCIIGIAIFLVDNTIQKEDENIVKWMITKSSVHIPSSAELKYISHQESQKTVMYSMKKEDLKDFVEKNKLQKINYQDIGVFMIQDIKSGGHTLNSKNDFYYMTDCKKGIVWDLLLDHNSGNLWFGVMHEDHSGDLPECDK